MDDEPLHVPAIESLKADDLFSPESLKKIYVEKLAPKKLRPGIDRVSAETFERHIDESVEQISRKLVDGTYYFSPYLQMLKTKGAGKAPRVIALPTVRDRIALSALKELLHARFHECVNRLIPNAYVKRIAASL